VVSLSSIQHGCDERLVFLGANQEAFDTVHVPPQCLDSPPAKLSPGDEDKVRARLAGETFVPFASAPVLIVEANETRALGDVKASLERKKVDHVSIPMAGSWDVFRDKAWVTCNGERTLAFDVRVENPSSGKVTVFSPGGGHLVVTYETGWGIEGDFGHRLEAAVLAPVGKKGCRVFRPK
jgi:hypothetical protein